MSTITAELLTQLLSTHREELLTAIGKMIQTTPPTAATAPAPKKSKKAAATKKEVESSAEPKEHKPSTNPWILFTKRVEDLIRQQEDASEIPQDQRMKTVVVKQLASALKERKAYDDWTDDEIQVEALDFVPPAVSKQAVAKSSNGSVASATEPKEEPVADAVVVAAAPEKKKGGSKKVADMTPEELEAHKAKLAERKAKKAADKPAEAEVTPTPAPAKPKALTIKPKTKPVEKPLDLSFFPWSHDGKEYYTNDRGDVATLDGEWVGRYDVKTQTIDESVPEPEDLATVTLRCE